MVILPPDFHHPLLNDSKQMTDKAREHIEAIRLHGLTPHHRLSYRLKSLE